MVIMKWLVQSQSDKDLKYVVSVSDRGEWRCDCPQGKYRRDRGPCKHALAVQAGQTSAIKLQVKLPGHQLGHAVPRPDAVSVAGAPVGARLRNVKEVFAKIKEEGRTPSDKLAPVSNDGVAGLLAALDDD